MIVALVATFSLPAFGQSLDISPSDAAIILQQSTVRMEKSNKAFCTATKVGENLYLTARHCTESLDEFNLRFDPTFELSYPKSATLPIGTKEPDDRKFDWALIETHVEMESVAAANYGCEEEIYLGMPVATFGYSGRTQPSFSAGYVASLTPGKRPNQFDFAVDLQIAPGASGSAVISLDTGDIIGVITEIVPAPRAGVYLTGAQLMSQTSLCD